MEEAKVQLKDAVDSDEKEEEKAMEEANVQLEDAVDSDENVEEGAMEEAKVQQEDAVDSDEKEEEATHVPRCCKRFKFDGMCFRTSVMVVVVIVYVIIGGAIFIALERPEEEAQNAQIEDAQSQLVILEGQIIDLLSTNETVDLAMAENLTNTLKQLVLQNATSTTDNWNYGSSVLFCTTSITTIGYGVIVPVTTGGRAFLIIYILLGIPLSLVLLTFLSNVFNSLIDWLLKKVTKKNEKRWFKILTFVAIVLAGLMLFIFIPSAIFFSIQGWTYFESIYYSFVTLTTVGFGDFVPTRDANDRRFQGIYRACTAGWIWLGLAFVALLIGRVQSVIEGLGESFRKAYHKHDFKYGKLCCGEKESSEEKKPDAGANTPV